MFKNRSWLSGMGVGLITGAILLQLMIASSAADQPSADKGSDTGTVITKENLETEAKAQGMTVLSESKLQELNALAEEAKKLKSSPTPAASETSSPQAAPTPSTVIHTAYIMEGMSYDMIEGYLSRAGFLSDRAAFRKKIMEGKLAGKIRSGYYESEANLSVDELITLLTQVPKFQ